MARKFTKPLRLDPARFALIAFERPSAPELTNPELSPRYPSHALQFVHQNSACGPVDLFIHLPPQLEFEDFVALDAISMLKPAVLPLDLIATRAGQIDARLRTDPAARHCAQPHITIARQAAELEQLKRQLARAHSEIVALRLKAEGAEVRTVGPDTAAAPAASVNPPLLGLMEGEDR